MAKTNVYSAKRLMAVRVGVPVGSGGTMSSVALYGFMTNISESLSTELGHVKGTTGTGGRTYIQDIIIGANAPKPARVQKTAAGYSVTSYVGHEKLSQALTKGWKLSKHGTYRIARHTKKSKLVYLFIRGIAYAWRMRTEQYAKLQQYTSNLGLKEAKKGDLELVYSPSFPRPPKVGIVIDNKGKETDTLSTFCEPEKLDNLPEGWFLIDPGNYV